MGIEMEDGSAKIINLPHLEIQFFSVRGIGAWLSVERDMPYLGTIAVLGLDLLLLGIRVVLFSEKEQPYVEG